MASGSDPSSPPASVPEEAEQELIHFLYQVPVGIARLADDGELQMANPASMQILQQIDPSSLNLFDLLRDHAPELELVVLEYRATRGVILEDYRVDFGHRSKRAALPLVVSFTLKKLSPERIVVVMSDVSASVASERAARAAEKKLAALQEQIRGYALFTLDREGTITEWPPAARQLFGFEPEQTVGRHLEWLGRDREATGRRVLAVAEDRGWTTLEGWWRRGDGTHFWGSAASTLLPDAQGKVIGFTCVVRIHGEAGSGGRPPLDTDPELGILSRSAFERVAPRLFEASRQDHAEASVALLALDGAAQLAEDLGEDKLPDLLRAVCSTLRDHLRPTDVLVRFEPQRLLVLAPATTPADVKRHLERARAALDQKVVDAESSLLKLTLHGGISASSGEDPDLLAAIGRAEAALETAASQGGNQVLMGHPGHGGRSRSAG